MSENRRVGDRQRDAAITALSDAFADGQLDASEFDERIDRVNAAKTEDDLTAVTSDLAVVEPAELDQIQPKSLAGKRWGLSLSIIGIDIAFALGIVSLVHVGFSMVVLGSVIACVVALVGVVILGVSTSGKPGNSSASGIDENANPMDGQEIDRQIVKNALYMAAINKMDEAIEALKQISDDKMRNDAIMKAIKTMTAYGRADHAVEAMSLLKRNTDQEPGEQDQD
jgi:hypothetical protein